MGGGGVVLLDAAENYCLSIQSTKHEGSSSK
jgi:hypothetical protein